MDFRAIPTDSLYKFMALSGLIVLLVSIVAPAWLQYNFELEVANLDEMNALNTIDLEKYGRNIDGFFERRRTPFRPCH